MYQFSYNDVIEDAPQTMRQHERDALDRILELLRDGATKGVDSKPAIEGLYYLRRLWGIFAQDLSRQENELPQELRDRLMALAHWNNLEIDRVHRGETTDLSALIEVNQIVRDGLQ